MTSNADERDIVYRSFSPIGNRSTEVADWLALMSPVLRHALLDSGSAFAHQTLGSLLEMTV